MITCRDVGIVRGGKSILQGVTLDAHPGEVLAFLGPNGAGKSSLLHAIAGNLRVAEGTIAVANRDVSDWHPRAMAAARAVLPQNPMLGGRMTVEDVVRLSIGPWVKCSHVARTRDALACVGIPGLSDRCITELSGGQQRLAHLARVLAQIGAPAEAEGKVLLLDEPLAGLDPARQLEVMEVLRRVARRGATVIVVLHEINHALNWSDRVALLHCGGMIACGKTSDALTVGTLREAFGTGGEIVAVGANAYYCPVRSGEDNDRDDFLV